MPGAGSAIEECFTTFIELLFALIKDSSGNAWFFLFSVSLFLSGSPTHELMELFVSPTRVF